MSEDKRIAALRQAWDAGRHQEFRRQVMALDGAAVDEAVIRYVDDFVAFFHEGKKIVATTDVDRSPADDELVIRFGNYPPGGEALVSNNPVRRNIMDYWTVGFGLDRTESHPCWDDLDRIFVINRSDRPDRLYSTMRELARAGAPLDRVVRWTASVSDLSTDKHLNGTLGCLTSHLEVCRRADAEGFRNILVLEDDFGFIDDLKAVRSAVGEFFRRRIDYDICLLATSKYGSIEPLDDLVSITRQKCTNAGAYFVSGSGLAKLISCFSHARERLIATGNCARFAADRCWADLQGERFLVFRRRLGFQLPSFSNIEQGVTEYLD